MRVLTAVICIVAGIVAGVVGTIVFLDRKVRKAEADRKTVKAG